MSSTSSTIKTGGVPEEPLKLFQPMNMIIFLSFYSPIILAIGVTGMSFIFQNFKGLIYLGFLIGCCVIRNYVYAMSISSTKKSSEMSGGSGDICNSIQFSKYGNPTFSSFVFAFTIMYLSLPMFSNGAPNYWVFSSLVSYFLVDIFIKLYKNCIVKVGDLFLNILLGAASAALIITMMYSGGSGKYLFFNEVSSDKEICYQPKKQTFRCSLYKNGELISGIN
jgi:hypothetical protein